ncbi:regulatory protein [Filimonas lacunae]|uniref:Regulatory protein RecX n=1 Tax=Filimonas lacunae TaxID=477680 RepID=A0A173MQ26_9BACT|nr:regulatory protein RecX [Filimonas lacunae]BAV09763.1 regulatory protein RecX [Filimonas lacunae]SIS78639.1 regulatory protein [Filimonas lacunae]
MQPFRNHISKEKAIPKIRHYCAYQERTHQEVKEKLYGFGLRKDDVEEILSGLIEEDYLNEERFACQFAGGKFRLKKWGRVKIMHELKQKGVSSYNLKKALTSIDEDDYAATLQKLAIDKWDSLKGEQYLNRQAKAISYLLQKGYELPLAQKAVKGCREGNDPVND